jgi:hypothetical protein
VVLEVAARESGVPIGDILENLPAELSVWVDPGEVSYRIGEKGAVKVSTRVPRRTMMQVATLKSTNEKKKLFSSSSPADSLLGAEARLARRQQRGS